MAIFRSKDETRTPFIALSVASVVNILLNLLFIPRFDWGVAVATTVIANCVSAMILFIELLKSDGVCVVNGFGQAATTFVGQNYGANNLPRCKRATWVSMDLSAIFMQTLCCFILFFA